MDVVGLGEVNKAHIAPGVFFPWNKLAEAGIGKSVTLPLDIDRTCKINLEDQGEQVINLKKKLQTYGYQVEDTNFYDNVTAKFVKNFVNRYLPETNPDALSNFAEDQFACWSDASEYALNEILGIDNQITNEL